MDASTLSALECQVIGAASEGVDPVESGQVHKTQLIGAVSLITPALDKRLAKSGCGLGENKTCLRFISVCFHSSRASLRAKEDWQAPAARSADPERGLNFIALRCAVLFISAGN